MIVTLSFSSRGRSGMHGDLLQVVDEHGDIAAGRVAQARGHLFDRTQRRDCRTRFDEDHPVGIAHDTAERGRGLRVVAQNRLQRPRTTFTTHELFRPLRHNDLIKVTQLQPAAQIDFRRVHALKAEQTVHEMGFGMLIREVEDVLIGAHRDIAGDLQRGNRLADALRAAQQNQFGFTQPAADEAIQRIKARRERHIVHEITARYAVIGFIDDLRQRTRQMRVPTRAAAARARRRR